MTTAYHRTEPKVYPHPTVEITSLESEVRKDGGYLHIHRNYFPGLNKTSLEITLGVRLPDEDVLKHSPSLRVGRDMATGRTSAPGTWGRTLLPWQLERLPEAMRAHGFTEEQVADALRTAQQINVMYGPEAEDRPEDWE